MTRKAFISGAIVLAIIPAVTGCSPSAGIVLPGAAVAAGSLPIKASGKALAFRANSTNTSSVSSYTNLPQSRHEITQASIIEKSAAGGIQIDGSVDKDPNPSNNQGTNPALVTAGSPDTLQNGTAIAGMKDAKGSVYFENGNFGDTQVSNDTANLSSVGVYNVYANNTFVEQIVMKHGTTIRYQEGADGAGTATYAVGYIGNNTTNMPGSGQASYKGFNEGGTTVYDDNGTMQYMGLSGGTVELTADFDAGTVKGGIKDAQLATYKNQQMVVLNNTVTGLNIDANITGSEYTGTAQLVDANNNAVGTTRTNEAIGAFFGNGAAETAAAYLIEGNAMLDGQNRDYIMSGTIGAVKK
ncbi:MAG: transferrin-binding protein-like solute binding protein [Hoeflea sp.]|uniref:transferrin-binding protein-like solute binding protein n=1 Tax=Hoeflea sp. TaxID=1940281 RepID=UPI0032999A26